MALREYAAKRRFDRTPEPAAKAGKDSGQLRFVVQKHQASRLHYDFRLELDGVLKSWAVPKGPSLRPGDKRLAMMVEDHPLDYRTFEGIIPEGNYGAGTVMVWDEGTYTDYENSPDLKEQLLHLRAGLKKGDLKFILHGRKLKGAYVLAKIKDEDNSWLLIKKADQFANDTDVTKQDRSAASGRSLAEITVSPGVWTGKLDLEDAPKAPFPTTVKPMLAQLAAAPFDRTRWLYEVKWDGYRIMALVNKAVKLVSRGNQNYSQIFSAVTETLTGVNHQVVLDGEMVVVDEQGRSSFQALQNYQRTGEGSLVYYVFDLLHADGHDLRSLPLERRKALLEQVVQGLSNVRYSDHVAEQGIKFFQIAQRQELEGVMAKDGQSPYLEGGRSPAWLKIKTVQRQEAVIGGYTEPRGGRKYFGALVLGVYEGDKLIYIGHTGGGFDEQSLEEVYRRLKPLERKTSPFSTKFSVNAPVHWVSPKLVCEVKFGEWTGDGHLRQPIFIGLRPDKDPRTVVRERPVVAPPVTTNPSTSRRVTITHPDKVFWPEDSYTKGDISIYYSEMAETILPYLQDRPQSLNRHPNGIHGPSFFQKDVEDHPDWIKTVPIYSESNGRDIHWLICNDRDTLLYLVNLGCIELNPWHSRIQQLDRPDYCLIDLDAKTSAFTDVIEVAQTVRQLLEELNLVSYPKTSGKTGLHICLPLGGKYTYEQSKQLAELLVRLTNQRLPKLTSVERSPKKRERKIYLDYLQNRRGQTMAAPYCLRPVPGATASAPLQWDEVIAGLDPRQFNIKTMRERLEEVGDIWKPVLGSGIDLQRVLKTLGD